MQNTEQDQLERDAAKARDASEWSLAQTRYQMLVRADSLNANHWHNLSLSYLGLGNNVRAVSCAERAKSLDASLWQSGIVLGKAHQSQGHVEQAEAAFQQVLKAQPINEDARLGLADLALNEFGDPLGAVEWVKPLSVQPAVADDAELTTLMASLYDRDFGAAELVQRVRTYAANAIQLPHRLTPAVSKIKGLRERKRVGLLSPQFCASPVYFLTFSFFKALSAEAELVFFSRSTREDWATEQFRSIATVWHQVQHVDALSLAQKIAAETLDEVYDLGGWMDPIGLRALSCRPASKQYKWVGGQSITTGLDCFDGWVGDRWHCPNEFRRLYSEPLINTVDDYATYVPPPYLPKPLSAKRKSNELAIFANPAKLSRAFLRALNEIPGKKCFIHRQYRHERVQDRLRQALGAKQISFILPESHEEALTALNRYAAVIDTFPYSSGLTAREAVAMEVSVKVLRVGELFCERHTARYAL